MIKIKNTFIQKLARRGHAKAISLLIVLGAISGCDRFVRYRLEGRIYDRDSKKPLANVPVAVELAWRGTTWGKDLTWGEEKFDKSLKSETNEFGVFYADTSQIVGGIGAIPPPEYLIRVGAPSCALLSGFHFKDGKTLEVDHYASVTGIYLNSSESESLRMSGQLEANNEVKLNIDLDQKKACDEAKAIAATTYRPRLGHDIVFVSYGDRLPRGLGTGYIHSFGNFGLFRLEVPVTAYGNSVGVAALVKVRLIPIWRFVGSFSIGPQYDLIDSNSLPGAHYRASDNGAHFAFNGSIDYSPRNGLYFEAGYASVTLGRDRRSEHFFGRVGLVF